MLRPAEVLWVLQEHYAASGGLFPQNCRRKVHQKVRVLNRLECRPFEPRETSGVPGRPEGRGAFVMRLPGAAERAAGWRGQDEIELFVDNPFPEGVPYSLVE